MEKWNEDLSALHDGEMDELGAMRILRALDQKPELLDQWELYAVIGESLRQSEPLTHTGMKGAQRALAVIASDQVKPHPSAPKEFFTALVALGCCGIVGFACCWLKYSLSDR